MIDTADAVRLGERIAELDREDLEGILSAFIVQTTERYGTTMNGELDRVIHMRAKFAAHMNELARRGT